MKRNNYLLVVFFVVSAFFISSCEKDNSENIIESTTTTLEPDFFEKNGSLGLGDEELEEEDAPTENLANAKSYGYYNYTLLKPSGLDQKKVNQLKCGETKTMPLLVGYYKKKVGTVKVSNDDENLYITVKADDYKYMKKVYFYIGDKGEIPFYSNGFPNLYKFNYKAFPYYFGGQKKATYVIPLADIDLDCFEVIAYAKIYDKGSWCYYSAFAYNKNLTQQYYYSYQTGCYYFKDWVRSFEYCKETCKKDIDYTYAWEDLKNIGNDTDYNDLVIDASVNRSASDLRINFSAKARGAAFDHEFKFKIPALGITNISGADNVELVDDYYFVTVFESTQAVLPAEGVGPNGYSANTEPGDATCTPNASTEIVITTNDDFVYDADKPYEPFITVTPFGPFGTEQYDLYIYEISGRDTWTDASGDEYPNGIVISSDWKWPLEETAIREAYPDFTSLTAGWTPNWADNLADASKVFNCN